MNLPFLFSDQTQIIGEKCLATVSARQNPLMVSRRLKRHFGNFVVKSASSPLFTGATSYKFKSKIQ
jgi:hypothetical protein